MFWTIIVALGIMAWAVFHMSAFHLSAILTIPDSFSYLQMASYLHDGKLEWFWTGWFWPLYSMFITLFSFVFSDGMLAAKILNVIFMTFGGYLLFLIGKRYLNGHYCVALLLMYALSSSLLYYKVNVLSENLYIPLFLLLVLLLHLFLENEKLLNIFFTWLVIGLMYLTRSEAFIYLGSIVLFLVFLTATKVLTLKEMVKWWGLLVLWFWIIASPYIFYLHTITWEWWLTNKWASNIRQAMMRGVDHMDDDGFEKAVWELDDTKTKLVSGFVGWLKYEKPVWDYSIKDYVIKNSHLFFTTFEQNQKKLYTETLPHMVIGDAIKFRQESSYFFVKGFPFLFLLYIPFAFILIWLWQMFSKEETHLIITIFPLFFIAALFFTFFFVLERYFIIFLPFIFIVMLYWAQNLFQVEDNPQLTKFIILTTLLVGVQWIGFWYDAHQDPTANYQVKEVAWEWLAQNKSTLFPWKEVVRIMERWPVVTYYSWEKERWLTPYTDQVSDVVTYAKANQIDVLVVDTLDFLQYRPQLKILLSSLKTQWLEKIIAFNDKQGNKVILYKFIY